MNTSILTSQATGFTKSHKRTRSNISVSDSPRTEFFPRPILRRRILSPKIDSDSDDTAESLPSPTSSNDEFSTSEHSVSTGKQSSQGTHMTDVDSGGELSASSGVKLLENHGKSRQLDPEKTTFKDDISDTSSDADSESSASSDSDESVINVAPCGNKPCMRLGEPAGAADDTPYVPLSVRLREFLPQLAAANAKMETERKAGNLSALSMESDFGDGMQYIEMDLGLGVLEERDPDWTSSSSESSEDELEQDEGEPAEPRYKENAMEKLMGQKPASGPKIEEV